jgi:large subunit ribosomal protein L18
MKDKNKIKHQIACRRRARSRATIFGTKQIPRLRVTKSLRYVYLQLINDDDSRTLVSFHSKKLTVKGKKVEQAFSSGEMLAAAALKAGIKKCVFDRGGHIYHGIVKAVAEGARKGGLQF